MSRIKMILLVLGAMIGSALLIGASAPIMGAGESAPSIPHCVSDDYNDGSQELCYTIRVTDGAVIVINRQDHVVSVSAE